MVIAIRAALGLANLPYLPELPEPVGACPSKIKSLDRRPCCGGPILHRPEPANQGEPFRLQSPQREYHL